MIANKTHKNKPHAYDELTIIPDNLSEMW